MEYIFEWYLEAVFIAVSNIILRYARYNNYYYVVLYWVWFFLNIIPNMEDNF